LLGCLYIICPEGKLSKPIQYILSLLFIVIIISCVKLPFIDKSIDFTSPQINTESYEELQLSSVRYVYSYALKKANLNFKEIYFSTDKSEDDSIVINKVTINSDCRREEIIKALGELAKTREVEIINE
jgi:hypothetical protein